MKKIKMLAIVTTAVCGFYFTSTAQTTQSSDKNDKKSSGQSTEANLNISDQDDEISLSSSPTIEKSSQGYKLQVWVQPEDASSTSQFDTRYDSKGLEDNDARIGNKRVNEGTSTGSESDRMNKSYDRSNESDWMNKKDDRKDHKNNTGVSGSAGVSGSGAGISGSAGTSGTGVSGSAGVSGSGAGVSGSAGTSGTGVSGSVGTSGSTGSTTGTTANPAGTTGSSGTTSTIGSTGTTSSTGTSSQNQSKIGSSTGTDRSSTANNQDSDVSRDTWRAQSNEVGQQSQSGQSSTTAMIDDEKSKVFVKIIDEKTGKEVDAKDIEMKVTTPSKKSFTTDLKERKDHHEGELALTEDGTYNIQATIKTDDNKSIVIPFTYDSKDNTSMNQSSDDDMDIDDNK